jgi:hypothetical protein
MDSRKSYDSDPVSAMLSRLEHKHGLSPGLSQPAAHLLASNALDFDHETGLQENLHPGMLQSPMALKGKAKDPDLPTTREALTGAHSEKFWTSMDKKRWNVLKAKTLGKLLIVRPCLQA